MGVGLYIVRIVPLKSSPTADPSGKVTSIILVWLVLIVASGALSNTKRFSTIFGVEMLFSKSNTSVFPPIPVLSTILFANVSTGPSFNVRNDLNCVLGGSLRRMKDTS